jgi:hypothetical protein
MHVAAVARRAAVEVPSGVEQRRYLLGGLQVGARGVAFLDALPARGVACDPVLVIEYRGIEDRSSRRWTPRSCVPDARTNPERAGPPTLRRSASA